MSGQWRGGGAGGTCLTACTAWRLSADEKPLLPVCRNVWGDGVRVLLRQVHVTQCWGRNHKKATASSKELCAALEKLMHKTSPGGRDLEAQEQAAIETVRQTWRDLATGPAWNDYFEARWIQTFPPRMWMTALRAPDQRAPSETRGAIKAFHYQLRGDLKRDFSGATRVDELIHMLDDRATLATLFEAMYRLRTREDKYRVASH